MYLQDLCSYKKIPNWWLNHKNRYVQFLEYNHITYVYVQCTRKHYKLITISFRAKWVQNGVRGEMCMLTFMSHKIWICHWEADAHMLCYIITQHVLFLQTVTSTSSTLSIYYWLKNIHKISLLPHQNIPALPLYSTLKQCTKKHIWFFSVFLFYSGMSCNIYILWVSVNQLPSDCDNISDVLVTSIGHTNMFWCY